MVTHVSIDNSVLLNYLFSELFNIVEKENIYKEMKNRSTCSLACKFFNWMQWFHSKQFTFADRFCIKIIYVTVHKKTMHNACAGKKF